MKVTCGVGPECRCNFCLLPTLHITTCSTTHYKQRAPLYPLQDFKALYKYCIIIINKRTVQLFLDLTGLMFNQELHSSQLTDLSVSKLICIITFCVSRRRRKMYCGHARLCVCLSAAVRPHYCADPDVTWGRGRGCPLVVHYWADLQSGHGLRCYGNIMRTLVTSLRPSRDMTT